MRTRFFTYLFLEVLSTILVVATFKLISDRNVAGLVAGSIFIALGTYIILDLTKRNIHFRTFSFYGAFTHLFFTGIPLITVRLLNWSTPHEDLFVLGVPAPTFHRIAEKVFVILVLCTVIDLIKTFLPVRQQKGEHS
jgi:uncharacterized protein (DUF486 family)